MNGEFNKKIGFRDFGIQEVTLTAFYNPAGKTGISVYPVFP